MNLWLNNNLIVVVVVVANHVMVIATVMANAMVIVVAKNVIAKKITISDQEAYQKKLLNIPYTDYQLEMLEYAKTHDVPVMQEEGIGFLIMLLKVRELAKLINYI